MDSLENVGNPLGEMSPYGAQSPAMNGSGSGEFAPPSIIFSNTK
jgi:hypothetical protein